MCGIAGIIGKNRRADVERMITSMRHRGPDDKGLYEEDEMSFGMARLAILDLSPLGHQPMTSHCGRYVIVYNGECYNYWDIRTRLQALGEKFASNSDTEVVLQAYVRWGAACVNELNGMFAFAIWDTREKKLFAARDHLGIKPFYYFSRQGEFIFASEIKTLLGSRQIDFEIDPKAVFQYFTFGYVQQPQTIIQSVNALMPGHFLEWKGGTLKIEKYWDVRVEDNKKISITYPEARDRLYELIADAVKMQLVSDRPLGLFLSGGLDSASVLAAMHSHGAAVRSFSIGFEQNPYARDESRETRDLASYFGIEHHQMMLDASSVRPEMENFWSALDQPSVDGLNTYLVSKYARQHMTVALSGLGGDELFAGYSRHARILWKLRHGSIVHSLAGDLVPSIAIRRGGAMGKVAFRAKSFADRKSIQRNYTYARTLEHPGNASRYLTRELRKMLDSGRLYADQFSRIFDDSLPTDLDKVLAMDLKAFMGSVLLRDMDPVSMWHSLEVRFPLIDYRLVEFAFSLPDSFKMGWDTRSKPYEEGKLSYRAGGTKKILADAMEKYLPPGLLDRPKNGFKLPVSGWLKGFKKEELYAMIYDRYADWSPYLEKNVVDKALTDFCSERDSGHAFWKILTFVGVISNLNRASK